MNIKVVYFSIFFPFVVSNAYRLSIRKKGIETDSLTGQTDTGSQWQALQNINEKMGNLDKKLTNLEDMIRNKSFERIGTMSIVNNGPIQVSDKFIKESNPKIKSELLPDNVTGIPDIPDDITDKPHIPDDITDKPHIPDDITDKPHIPDDITDKSDIPDYITDNPDTSDDIKVTTKKSFLDVMPERNYSRFLNNDSDTNNNENEMPKIISDSLLKYIPKDCSEISSNISGGYLIKPARTKAPFFAYCDMETDGGGWTIFQLRQNGRENFYRIWNDYKYGFGGVEKDHWLGLEKLHHLTSSKYNELFIELQDYSETEKYARYTTFGIEGSREEYRISSLGTYSGTAGDSFSYHSGAKFSTIDNDNDENKENCAEWHTGAWWYRDCDDSNLNGQWYSTGYVTEDDEWKGVYWSSFRGSRYSMKKTKMMIRPKSY